MYDDTSKRLTGIVERAMSPVILPQQKLVGIVDRAMPPLSRRQGPAERHWGIVDRALGSKIERERRLRSIDERIASQTVRRAHPMPLPGPNPQPERQDAEPIRPKYLSAPGSQKEFRERLWDKYPDCQS